MDVDLSPAKEEAVSFTGNDEIKLQLPKALLLRQ
jgi:hypothetical protein